VPEGDVHRELVRLLSGRIAGDAPAIWASFIDGARLDARDGIPPIVGTHRPDVYAVMRGSGRTVIGEAKTAVDIDNEHTKRQLSAYFQHLGEGAGGEVWMAVPLMSAGTAYRVCRVVRYRLSLVQIRVIITGWLFGPKPVCETWHG
jgi:hypothetical protein